MIQIRNAAATDAPFLAALLGELGYPSAADALPARLAALESGGGAALLAVNPEGRPVGLACVTSFASLHADAPICYITALVTTRDSRGQGVGRELVAAAEQWARGRGCARLSVTSAEHRADAHAFYPRCGLPYSGRRFTKQLAAPT